MKQLEQNNNSTTQYNCPGCIMSSNPSPIVLFDEIIKFNLLWHIYPAYGLTLSGRYYLQNYLPIQGGSAFEVVCALSIRTEYSLLQSFYDPKPLRKKAKNLIPTDLGKSRNEAKIN